MKKRFIIILSALALLLSGCVQPQSDKKKLQVVAAIFPEYDWVRQIVGNDDSVELTLLVDDGVDPHSFQPAVSDMVTAANCDLLIYGGGESSLPDKRSCRAAMSAFSWSARETPLVVP